MFTCCTCARHRPTEWLLLQGWSISFFRWQNSVRNSMWGGMLSSVSVSRFVVIWSCPKKWGSLQEAMHKPWRMPRGYRKPLETLNSSDSYHEEDIPSVHVNIGRDNTLKELGRVCFWSCLGILLCLLSPHQSMTFIHWSPVRQTYCRLQWIDDHLAARW